MRKIFLIITLSSLFFSLHAQEKGLYLTVDGRLGLNNLLYQLPNNYTSKPDFPGFGGSFGIQYFFTKNWGIATSVGLSFYNTKSNFSESWENDPQHYLFQGMNDLDHEPGTTVQTYDMRIGLSNWEETQQAYLLEIPLMLMYQTKWGAKKAVGMYAGIGAKVQVPVFDSKYKVSDNSELQVLGYFGGPNEGLLLGDPIPLPEYGFGKTTERLYQSPSGNFELKTGFAATAELGFLFTLSPRVDLTLGGYIDYGFTNVKGENTENTNLIEPIQKEYAMTYIGDNLRYNSYLNSYAVDKVNTFGYGGKLGLRIRLGKLSKAPKLTPEPVVVPTKPEKYPYSITVVDSLTGQRIMTQIAMECTDCGQAEAQTFYSSKDSATIANLRPNKNYRFNLNRIGFPAYQTTMNTTDSSGEMILKIPLHPEITGTVRNTKNNLQADANIQLTNAANGHYSANTDSSGKFVVKPVAAGTHYTIIGSKTGYVSDTVTLYIPASPDSLQPSYTVAMELKPVKKLVLSALVLFDLAQSSLRLEAKRELDRMIPMLNENPEIQITVEGHTDSRGSAAYNDKLSLSRANAVRDYMLEQGIDSKRVTTKGCGFSRLVNKCKPKVKCTDEEHQENRRVEFIFTEKKK